MKASLLVATKTDPASMNIAGALLNLCSWKAVGVTDTDNEVYIAQSTSNAKPIYLWVVNQSMLRLNYAQNLFANDLHHFSVDEGPVPDFTDVMFLSKHAAASGTVSLTVHPIGVPWMADPGRFGGLPGRCSPPNPHIGALYRSLLHETKIFKLDSTFQVSMEATHHGPFVEVPTCFVEIGSSESEWSQPDAGRVWASCLSKYLQLPLKETEMSSSIADSEGVEIETAERIESIVSRGLACLSIGGGHYVPKLNDMTRFGPNFFVAHALASYTLEHAFEDSEEHIAWNNILKEAIDSTRITFPDTQIICMVDKKAFNSEQRNKVTSFLDSQNVKWTFKTADVKKLYDELTSAAAAVVSTAIVT